MITYKSTRGKDEKNYTFSEAILKGLAADGGLLVPTEIPIVSLKAVQEMVDKTYQERAVCILNMFKPDLTLETTKRLVYEAYGENFDISAIAPLVPLKDNQYMLELWHGPTAAFKDMALQLMPLFFAEAVKKENEKRKAKSDKQLSYLILIATSGDTGKAALEGYKNKEAISIVVLYPNNRVSKLQELQMATQAGNNVNVFALEGDFDAVQTTVKDIFNDKEFNEKLLIDADTVLSSANSINWGRLLPQIIYYFSAYMDLIRQKAIRIGEEIDTVVPTGNFGNLLAAFYAKKMGLPIRKLVCASNTNNVLTDFLQTGIYDISSRNLIQTPSPSMDILIASNIERLLYLLTDNNELVSSWMNDLQTKRRFVVDDKTRLLLGETFAADWVSNEESLETIKNIFDQTGYLMDTHTAVAQRVGERYMANNNDVNSILPNVEGERSQISTEDFSPAMRSRNDKNVPLLICSTAHWSKFVKDIYPLFSDKPVADEFAMLEEVANQTNQSIPENIRRLKQKPIRFNEICAANKEKIESKLIDFLKTESEAL